MSSGLINSSMYFVTQLDKGSVALETTCVISFVLDNSASFSSGRTSCPQK